MRRYSSYLSALGVAAGSLAAAQADFTPVTLTPDSFNQDMVVEKGAIHAPSATTGSMDEGSGNTGFGWYETGYNTDSPDTGLPAAGSTVTSAVAADHSYTFASTYKANNALLVDTNTPLASLTLTTPAPLAAISLLTSAGHGPVTNRVVIHYAGGAAETNTFVAADWFGTNAAVSANGRIDVVSLGFANVSSGNPNLYAVDIPLTQSGNVTGIDIQNGGTGNGHTAVFAVSGATSTGGPYTPLTVTGYNRDLVVEADAPRALTSLNATTASMDAGTANTGATWYERGYLTNSVPTNSLQTGLPPAGTVVTNTSAPDHRYLMPASYVANNALLVDPENSGTLHFTTPTLFSSLSFLTAAGNGPVTVGYTVNHQDGTTETGTFVSPDWFNNANQVFTANGRVDVQSGLLSAVNTDNPRLYPADITGISTNSPITTVDLTLSEGTGHAAIFAVSGILGNVPPLVAGQPASVTVLEGGSVQLNATVTGTLPFTYAWQVETNGNFINLQNGTNITGANSGTLVINSALLTSGARYRLAVTNISGSTFSLPATLTVLSGENSVLSASDTVVAVGGTSPDAEAVEHVIDQDTAKYLNFGTDGDQAAPFVGPVGFIVMPTLGADASGTVVNALRIYTANDAPERDPASYTVEGSNNGTNNFSLIASGTLALPDARNAGGQPLDPLTQALQEVRFTNSVPYKAYRVLFQNVKNNATANSVQIGEVQLLGTVATGSVASLTITANAAGTLTITSSAPGALQSTTALAPNGGATNWVDEGPINGSTTVSASGRAKFYRVLVQQ